MPMPGTQEIRKPLLEMFRGEAPRNFVSSEVLELIAECFSINLNDLSSGDKNILKSRINEAKSDLKRNGLIYNPSGNTYMITNAGTDFLEGGPEVITDEYLRERKKRPLPVAETFGLVEAEAKPVTESITSVSEVLTDDPEEIPLDDEPEAPNNTQEPDALTEASQDIAPDEPETTPEIHNDTQEPDALTEDSQYIAPDEPETTTEIHNDTQEPDALTDDTQDIAPNEPDTVPEITDDSQDVALDDDHDTLPESQTEPQEISLTEEVYTETMPEDLFSPEETQDDIARGATEAPQDTETEYEEEEEYDPSLVAEAMSAGGIDDVIARHNSELADSLLMKTAALPSDRFEMLVIDLLSKMGYFAFQTARYTTESSGSGLIHGVILDNKTGANIYIQARKLSPGRTVGKADIQEFVDELADKGGKGIFATTASFSENATILASDERLMLIDGERLANLMIANNFCVNVEKVYEIKAIDNESFSEYED